MTNKVGIISKSLLDRRITAKVAKEIEVISAKIIPIKAPEATPPVTIIITPKVARSMVINVTVEMISFKNK